MTIYRASVCILLAAILSGGLLACSSGDSDDNTKARVYDLEVDDPTLSRGDESRIDVTFTFARDAVFDDDRDVIIAIRLPNGIRYIDDSGRVESIGSDDDVSPRIFRCEADGGQLLVFNLDEDDLTNAEDPSGEADGKLQLDVEAALSGVGTGTVEARAGYDLVYTACDASFFGEEVALITVFP